MKNDLSELKIDDIMEEFHTDKVKLTLEEVNKALEEDKQSSNYGNVIGNQDYIRAERNVFKFPFEKDDILELEECIDIFNKSEQKDANIDKLLNDIENYIDKMCEKQYCPFESILYVSKKLENAFDIHKNLSNSIASLLAKIFQKSEIMEVYSKAAVEHIISKWTWKKQLEIVNVACGYYGKDLDLLNFIIKHFEIENDVINNSYLVSIVSMIVFSHRKELSEKLISITSKLNNNKESDIIRKIITDKNGYSTFGDAKIIINNFDNMSTTSKRIYRIVLKAFEDRGAIRGRSNDEISLLVDKLKNNTYRNDDLLKIYSYFQKNRNIGTLTHYIRLYKIYNFKEYLRIFLQDQRIINNNLASYYYDRCAVYNCYVSLSIKDKGELAFFFENQLTKFPNDKNIIEACKSNINYTNYDLSFLKRGLKSSFDEEAKSIISYFSKFSVIMVNYVRDAVKMCLESSKDSHEQKINTLKNYNNLLIEEYALFRKELRITDSLFKYFKSISEQNKFDTAIMEQIIKIIKQYPDHPEKEQLLIQIYRNTPDDKLKRKIDKEINSFGLKNPS